MVVVAVAPVEAMEAMVVDTVVVVAKVYMLYVPPPGGPSCDTFLPV